MDKWNLIIDVAGCENCNNCVIAAKDELVGNDFPGYSAPHAAQGPGVIQIRRKVRGRAPMVDAAYVPVMCNHCDNAPCIGAAGGAITQRPDGIVIIDPVKAKGRRDLVDACPYGAIVWNEEQQLPQNWFFDAHLLDAGAKAPRCVGVCPTVAIEAVKTTDTAMADRVQREQLRPLRPELGTRPRVYYRNLQRFDHCFIGGSLCASINGQVNTVEGVTVELRRDGSVLATRQSDAFGDFKFDGITPGAGRHEIVVAHPGYGMQRIDVQMADESVYLGDIRLTAG